MPLAVTVNVAVDVKLLIWDAVTRWLTVIEADWLMENVWLEDNETEGVLDSEREGELEAITNPSKSK